MSTSLTEGSRLIGKVMVCVAGFLFRDRRLNRYLVSCGGLAQSGVSVTLRKNHTLSQTILYGLRIAFIHRRSRNRQSMTSRNRKLVSKGNLWPGGIF